MIVLNAGVLRIAKFVVPFAALVPLAFGISLALGKLAPDNAEAAAKSEPSVRAAGVTGSASRLALIIGNADYPDAYAPLAHPVKDAQALADALRRSAFEVDLKENLGKDDMKAAFEAFKAKIRPGSVALVFFGGFGIQVDRQSYMIPVDATIWREGDVRRDGISIDSVLADMDNSGAKVKLAILDASRRNPYERRFRTFSAGLSSIDAPLGTLLLSAAAPGKVIDDAKGTHSLMVGELLKEINLPGVTAESLFNHTRIGISRASGGEQIPLVSSSLVENFAFVPGSRELREPRVNEIVDRPSTTAPRFRGLATRQNDDEPVNKAPATSTATKPERTATSTAAKPEKTASASDGLQYEPASRPVEKSSVTEAKPSTANAQVRRPRQSFEELRREIVSERPRPIARRSAWYSSGSPRTVFENPTVGIGN